MRRAQLEHAIQTASQIIEMPEIIVVGSQSILGTYSEDQLPVAATMTVEVDVLPIEPRNSGRRRSGRRLNADASDAAHNTAVLGDRPTLATCAQTSTASSPSASNS